MSRSSLSLGIALIVALAGCSGGSSGSDSDAPDDGLMLPLIGEGLDGITPEVLTKTLEAAAQGLGYDFENGSMVALPAPSQLFLRPGTQILPESVFPGWCTAAFVFDDRSRIATAGHCTESGDAVLAIAAPSTIFVVGYTTSSTGLDSELGDDWALIDILPMWQPFTDPAVALVGGPCGRAGSPPAPLVAYVGHAEVIGTGGTPRIGVSAGNEDSAFAVIGPSSFGDSGAPVLEAIPDGGGSSSLCLGGGAIGILTHGVFVEVDGLPGVPTGVFFGTPLARIGNELDDGALLP